MRPSPPVVLLGAGASAEAGIPTSFGMTKSIVDAVNADHRAAYLSLSQALNFVCGSLVAYDAAAGSDPFAGLDVERVFAAIELLARRRDLEVSPFVSTWHPAVETWDRPRSLSFWSRDLHKSLSGAKVTGERPQEIVTKLIKAQTAPGDGATYEALKSHMVTELVRLLETTPKAMSYLGPLVRQGDSPTGLTVATLNYDLSVEHACDAEGVTCESGISQWTTAGSWDWPQRGVRLLKLHGSIDWAWVKHHGEAGRLPGRTVAPIDTQARDRQPPALVFGHGAKLRPDGPFLSLLGEFEKLLANAEELLVVGYSFRDDHINEVIRRWFTELPASRITLIDPDFRPRRIEWDRKPSLGDELASFFRESDRFQVINQVASRGLRAVFPGT